MQTLLEILKNLWGKPWFSEVLVILFFVSIFLWQKYSETEKALRQTIKSKPNDYKAHYNLGILLAEDEIYDDAEIEFKQAIALNPQDISIYYSLFWLLDETNKPIEAEDVMKQALALFPKDGLAYTYLGIALEKQEKHIEAENAFKKALSMAPNLSHAHIYYGRFLAEQNRYDEAQKEFQLAISIDPSEASGHLNLAKVYESINRSQDAESIYKKLISHQPYNKTAYVDLWNLYKAEKRFDDADAFFKQASLRKAKDSFLKHFVVLSLWEQNKFDELEVHAKELVRLIPNDVNVLLGYGHALGKLKKDNNAISIYQQAVEKFPDKAETHFFLGQAFEKSLEYEKAEKCFKIARELAPYDNWLFEYQIRFLRKVNKYQEALDILFAFLKDNPEDFISLLTIASIKKSVSETEDISDFIEKAREYVPRDDNYWYNMACIEAILGNNLKAFENLERANAGNHLDVDWAWEDPDLQWIRDDPRFVKTVGTKSENKK